VKTKNKKTQKIKKFYGVFMGGENDGMRSSNMPNNFPSKAAALRAIEQNKRNHPGSSVQSLYFVKEIR